jgi:hypothetical protein
MAARVHRLLKVVAFNVTLDKRGCIMPTWKIINVDVMHC